MSAFICGEKHILQLAAYYTNKRYNGMDDRTNDVANKLYQENIKSVRHRYPNDSWDELPGPIGKSITLQWETMIRFSELTSKPVTILKWVQCYECQSCEHPEWEQSEAFRIVQQIKADAIQSLPGYEDAPWECVA